jgi:GNAT superfamily N-acetyltransferase
MNADIRPAVAADAGPIAALLREMGWFAAFQAETESQSQERVGRHLAQCLADASHSLFVAENEAGELVGYMAIHWLPYLMLAGPEGYVSELFIRADSRGQGLGRCLLEVAKAEAKQRNCIRLSLLNVRERESYQRGFYRKAGWEERPQIVNFVYWLEPH